MTLNFRNSAFCSTYAYFESCMQRVSGCVDDALLNAMSTSKCFAGAVIKYDVNGAQKIIC